MVHHSCYLNNSFEADWLLFLVLGRLQLHLSCTPWRVLRAFSHELADSRSPEALGPQGLPDLQVGAKHDFQAEAFQLGRAGHGWFCPGRVRRDRAFCLCFSRLRFRIWAVMELQRWWNSVRNCRMIINLYTWSSTSHYPQNQYPSISGPIIYGQYSSDGRRHAGIRYNWYNVFIIFGLLRQPN